MGPEPGLLVVDIDVDEVEAARGTATPRKELVNMQRGEPVVMLHGIGTSPGVWDGWLPALAGRHEIVRPPLRGLDGRATPPDPGTLLDAVIGDVLASIPPGHKAHLVGESTGGSTWPV